MVQDFLGLTRLGFFSAKKGLVRINYVPKSEVISLMAEGAAAKSMIAITSCYPCSRSKDQLQPVKTLHSKAKASALKEPANLNPSTSYDFPLCAINFLSVSHVLFTNAPSIFQA